MKVTPNALINRVIKKFNLLLEDNTNLSSLYKKISEEGDIILFGGAVRDFYFNQNPRDYDIVINTTNHDISGVFEGYCHYKNRFGGYKINVDNITFDIWTLPSTWAFNNNILDCNVENLSKTVFFNIDSIAVNLTKSIIYENGFFDALWYNNLEIVLQDNPCPELCVLRALYFKYYRFFDLSEELDYYVYDWIKSCYNPLDRLTNVQNTHYGKDFFTTSMLNSSILSYLK